MKCRKRRGPGIMGLAASLFSRNLGLKALSLALAILIYVVLSPKKDETPLLLVERIAPASAIPEAPAAPKAPAPVPPEAPDNPETPEVPAVQEAPAVLEAPEIPVVQETPAAPVPPPEKPTDDDSAKDKEPTVSDGE